MDKRYLIGAGAVILVIGMIIALYATYPQINPCKSDSDCDPPQTCNGYICK